MRFTSRMVLHGAVAVLLMSFSWLATANAQPHRYPYPYPLGRYVYAGPQSDVRLEVRPREATVYVDGYFAGTVDDFDGVFERLHVTPGPHEIVVYLEGYRSIRERLYFSPNATRKITRTMERLAAGEPNEPLPVPAEPPDPATAPAPGADPRRGPPSPPDRVPTSGISQGRGVRLQADLESG